MNNTVLGMVHNGRKCFTTPFLSDRPAQKTDFVKLAEAFGCTGNEDFKNSEVEPVIKAALELNRPVVVDCRISPDANVLPMIPPGGTVERNH